jgi:hypothetical protein
MSANFAPLFAKSITKHYGLEAETITPTFSKLFNVETMTGAYSDDQLWEMYTGPEPKLPLRPVAQGTFGPSFAKRWVPVLYALGDVIAEEHAADDPTGTLHTLTAGKGGALARSFATHREWLAAELLTTLAFGTAPVSGSPDGQPLFSTAHPVSAIRSGTTVSNRPSAYCDLSHAAWSAMRANLVQQMAPNNYMIVDNKPAKLCVNPTQHVVATRLVRGEMEPGTGDNNINVAKLDNVQIVEWPYFRKTGATAASNSWNAWFVLGQTNYLRWFDRSQFKLVHDYDITVLGYVFVAYMRYICGWLDWRGTYGSAGV